jgi:hypothetical protein
MANTYTLIEGKTLASNTASIAFTSIPQTYTDLQLVFSARLSQAGNADVTYVMFNSNTSNYSQRLIYKDSTEPTALSFTTSTALAAFVGADSNTANTFGNSMVYIPNYTSSNNKSYFCDFATEQNSNVTWMGLNSLLWSNTAAITEINLTLPSGSFKTGSTFYLYGIKNS